MIESMTNEARRMWTLIRRFMVEQGHDPSELRSVIFEQGVLDHGNDHPLVTKATLLRGVDRFLRADVRGERARSRADLAMMCYLECPGPETRQRAEEAIARWRG